MIQETLSRSYYGNTVSGWLTALAIIVGAVLLGKLAYWIFGNVFKKLSAKTETKLDDLIIDMIEEPVVLVISIGGIWYGLGTLQLPERATVWMGNALHFVVILTIAWLVSRLFDALYREYVAPLADKTETDLDDQLLPILRKGT